MAIQFINADVRGALNKIVQRIGAIAGLNDVRFIGVFMTMAKTDETRKRCIRHARKIKNGL